MSEAVQPTERIPSLRGALWLYFLVLIGTTLAFYLPAASAPRVFLSLVASLFITLGFTLAAIFINKISFSTLMGARPQPVSLVLSFFAGLAVWIPATWCLLVPYAWLDSMLGARLSVSEAQLAQSLDQTVPAVMTLLVLGIIVPVCQGLLFWGYLRRAEESRVGEKWAALAVVMLFGLFGLYSNREGMSAIPEMLLVGAVATAAVYFTKSAWSAIAVLIGFNLGEPLLTTALQNYMDIQNHYDEAVNPFSGRWLLIVIAMVFFAFFLIQLVRATSRTSDSRVIPHIPPKRWWWLPVILSVVFSLYIVFGEVVVRQTHPISTSSGILSNPSGSTIPPIGVTATPPTVAPPAPPPTP